MNERIESAVPLAARWRRSTSWPALTKAALKAKSNNIIRALISEHNHCLWYVQKTVRNHLKILLLIMKVFVRAATTRQKERLRVSATRTLSEKKRRRECFPYVWDSLCFPFIGTERITAADIRGFVTLGKKSDTQAMWWSCYLPFPSHAATVSYGKGSEGPMAKPSKENSPIPSVVSQYVRSGKLHTLSTSKQAWITDFPWLSAVKLQHSTLSASQKSSPFFPYSTSIFFSLKQNAFICHMNKMVQWNAFL